jgi:hypothetical protein
MEYGGQKCVHGRKRLKQVGKFQHKMRCEMKGPMRNLCRCLATVIGVMPLSACGPIEVVAKWYQEEATKNEARYRSSGLSDRYPETFPYYCPSFPYPTHPTWERSTR